MTLDDLLTNARSVLRDFATPPLWSDELITLYLNEAQGRVARLTHSFIPDKRELSLSVGEDIYPMDEDILFVYSVQLAGYEERLTPSTDGWTPDYTVQTRPSRYTLDSESQSIRFYPIPDGDYTAKLRISRLPVELVNGTDEPELPGKYQLALVDWAAYRCFTHDDADGLNKDAADRARLRFDDAISDIKYELYRQQTGAVPRVHGHRVK